MTAIMSCSHSVSGMAAAAACGCISLSWVDVEWSALVITDGRPCSGEHFHKQRSLPPARGGGYVFVAVCASVCAQNISKTCGRIVMKFFGGVGRGQRNHRLV